MDPVSRAQSSTTTPRKVIGRPFQKGQSGNPGGRPKKLRITKLFEKILNSGANRTELEEIIKDMLRSRRMASVLLLREMAERTEGKVTQPVEVEGSGLAAIAAALTQLRERKNQRSGDKDDADSRS